MPLAVRSKIRNWACALLAAAFIVSGRVRRARRQALNGEFITSIYFHKPNRRLFRRCIGWLVKHGFVFLTADEVTEALRVGRFPKRAVWLSFDDGCRELLDDVVPLVSRRRIPITIFVPSAIVEGNGLFPWVQSESPRCRDAMTIEELKEISKYPEVTIGSHTVTHANLTSRAEPEIRFELEQSKRDLEAWTGKPVHYFSYPWGRCDGREKLLLAEFRYRLAASTENGWITRDTDAYLVPRFSIGDDIPFLEAICNMVGVWRPAIDAVKRGLGSPAVAAAAPSEIGTRSVGKEVGRG